MHPSYFRKHHSSKRRLFFRTRQCPIVSNKRICYIRFYIENEIFKIANSKRLFHMNNYIPCNVFHLLLILIREGIHRQTTLKCTFTDELKTAYHSMSKKQLVGRIAYKVFVFTRCVDTAAPSTKKWICRTFIYIHTNLRYKKNKRLVI